jgi:Protein of unknown function (DUF2505)
MAKQVRHHLTYDAALPEVAAMLADPAFREAVCERQRVLRATVAIEPEDAEVVGAGTRVSVDQVQAARGIPSFATKFVGDEIHIVQRESWRDDTTADLTWSIPGKPGEMTGTSRLHESGGQTTQTVDLTVKVSIPLVGGRLEGFIADLLVKALDAEARAGRDYLAG